MDDAIHNLIQPCIAKHWRQDGPCVELVGFGLDEIPRVTRPGQRFPFPFSKFSTIKCRFYMVPMQTGIIWTGAVKGGH